jgi:hypothetical protein
MDKLYMIAHFPVDTSQPEKFQRVLELLEAEPLLVPTHAGYDERKRQPYDRETALATVPGKRGGLILWRSKAPKYSRGYASTNRKGLNWMKVELALPSNKHIEGLFEAWTRLCDECRPQFGFIHSLWARGAESQPYNDGHLTAIRAIRDHGLANLHARTWFGPDLVLLMGKERLLSLPHTQATDWGGVVLDLVDKPWESDFETLYKHQQERLQVFRSWGVVGDYSRFNQPVAGPSWTPRLWGGW